MAAKVVATSLVHPYNEKKPRILCGLSRSDLADRTIMDLATAAAREAKSRDIALRETLEQVAYNLLVGRIKL